MQKNILKYLINPYSAEHNVLKSEIFEQNGDRIVEAILYCEQTAMWFPVHQEIAEIVPVELMSNNIRNLFKEKYQSFFASNNFLNEALPDGGDLTIQKEQQRQYDDFVTDEKFNYSDFENLMFWKVVDKKVFGEWKIIIKENTRLLDVGCGNGRSSLGVYKPNLQIVGMDLSRESVVKAIIRARENGMYDNQTYLVADANALPFVKNSFDYAVTSGVLSQVPDPGATCRQIDLLLKSGGVYFGMENNKSVFRAVFDLLMKLSGKWKKNVTGGVPEISYQMLRLWFSKCHVKFYTMVFNSPTTYNSLEFEAARRKMETVNRMFTATYVFKNHGGLIIYQIHKQI